MFSRGRTKIIKWQTVHIKQLRNWLLHKLVPSSPTFLKVDKTLQDQMVFTIANDSIIPHL